MITLDKSVECTARIIEKQRNLLLAQCREVIAELDAVWKSSGSVVRNRHSAEAQRICDEIDNG